MVTDDKISKWTNSGVCQEKKSTKIGMKEETGNEKMKRSPDERHKHGSLTDTFRQLQTSFSIRRE